MQKGGAWQNFHPSKEVDGVNCVLPMIRIWTLSPHQNVSMQKAKHTKFSQSSCTQCKWFKQRVFLKFNPNLFLILVVITLHQTWPLFFMSMPCILEEPWTLRSKNNNLNMTSPSKTVGKNGLFEHVSCHNPNFIVCWNFVLKVPLPKEDEGCDDKAENGLNDRNYGCKEPNWKIKFGDIVDKEWGVKLSPKEELDSSMKSNEKGLTENKGRMSLTSCSRCTILTTNLVVLGVKIISWELWIRLLPTM